MKKIITCTLILLSSTFVSFRQADESQPITAKRSILDYYNALKGKLGIHARFKITKKDINNGYLSASAAYMSAPGAEVVTMALWRSRGGKELVGVFKQGCGGMGCWGDLKDFKIFDANLNEVQRKELNWKILETRSKMPVTGQENAPKYARKLKVELPQKGTSIKIYRGVVGIKQELMATLVYNYNQGTFSIK